MRSDCWYVIRLLAVLLLCNDGTFKTALGRRIIFSGPTGIGRALTRHLLNATRLRRCRSRRPPVALVCHQWRIEMPVEKSRRTALVLATLAFSAIALAP